MTQTTTTERQKALTQRDEKEIRISHSVYEYKLGLYILIGKAAEAGFVTHTTVSNCIRCRAPMMEDHKWQNLFTAAAESTIEKWCKKQGD